MDSRNFSNEPIPSVENGMYLEGIFSLQRSLLEHYIGIEGLPEYPIDVNSKKNQILLKDFTGRVIEELGEGYESLIKVQRSNLSLVFYEDKPTLDMVKSEIQNMNEEFADALHFILELMIYANILPEDIYAFCKKIIKEWGIPFYDVVCLSQTMQFGSTVLSGASRMDGKEVYNIPHDPDVCTPIGWSIGSSMLSWVSIMLWDITYSLSIARNCLKNKPWKQSGELTDENLYQQLLCEAFVKLMGFYRRLGYTDESLYKVYYLKNKVNNFRIASKY